MKKTVVRSFLETTAVSLAVSLAFVPSGAQAKEVVKIAFIGPLTGGSAAIGLGGRDSADLAVRLHNANPKAKYTYQLVVQDDECRPNIGVQVATKMGADKSIIGGITHYCSAVASATVGVYHRFHMPAIVWGAVLPEITYGHKYPEVFRVNGTMINQNEVAVKFMHSLGYKTWGVIHDTTDYGKGHDEYFKRYLKQYGGTILADFGVTVDQQDFTTELTKIKEAHPQALFFGGLTPLGVRIRTQMDKLGVVATFEGTSGIKSDAYIAGVGPKVAEGSLSFLEGAPLEKLPGGAYFTAQYDKQNYGERPEAYGPFAFVAANLLMNAIDKVGPNRKKVTDELHKTKDVDTIIGKVTFDDHGQNIVPLVTKYVVDDGKWVVWEDSAYAKGTKKLPGL
ncbi:MAG: branched-chain amino acid ABC transporter substrate-binding protein [Candidimonas sp.]|nr:MAG: branched-chain amino acid ABC transporter substrate-binding protein [Candidimonas sp.]